MGGKWITRTRRLCILLAAAEQFWLGGSVEVAAQQATKAVPNRNLPNRMPAIEALASFPAHAGQVFAAEFSPNGKWLATRGRDGLIALRDASTGEVLKTLAGHRGLIFDVAFSPDSGRLASASADGTVKLWSPEQKTPLASYNAFRSRISNIRSIAFSPDGLEIASGCEDGTIKLWNMAEGQVRLTLQEQALAILSVQYSPTGMLLATSTGINQQSQIPGELKLWDAKSGEEVANFDGQSTEIKRLAFTADGQRLASIKSDRSVLIWNVADRTIAATFKANAAATAIVFLADPNLLAIGDVRGGVAIYDIAQGISTRRFAGHDKLIPAITVRPDQQILATASHDGTVKLWPLTDNR
jgi:WD40 repeat protein